MNCAKRVSVGERYAFSLEEGETAIRSRNFLAGNRPVWQTFADHQGDADIWLRLVRVKGEKDAFSLFAYARDGGKLFPNGGMIGSAAAWYWKGRRELLWHGNARCTFYHAGGEDAVFYRDGYCVISERKECTFHRREVWNGSHYIPLTDVTGKNGRYAMMFCKGVRQASLRALGERILSATPTPGMVLFVFPLSSCTLAIRAFSSGREVPADYPAAVCAVRAACCFGYLPQGERTTVYTAAGAYTFSESPGGTLYFLCGIG